MSSKTKVSTRGERPLAVTGIDQPKLLDLHIFKISLIKLDFPLPATPVQQLNIQRNININIF